MYKRIYDSDEIVVDLDGRNLRISVFEDGHWVDEHFVELSELEPVVRCKDCEKSREWGNGGTLLCYRDETTIHIVKPDAYCDGSQRRCGVVDPGVLEFEPVVHAHWVTAYEFDFGIGEERTTGYNCSRCGIYSIKKDNRCPDCGAHMDEEVAE